LTEAERIDAFAAAWEQNRHDLLQFVLQLAIAPEAAADIVQHTGHRAMLAVRAPGEPQETRKWLFRIASDLAIAELRQQGATLTPQRTVALLLTDAFGFTVQETAEIVSASDPVSPERA
jgi:hypothetical protein